MGKLAKILKDINSELNLEVNLMLHFRKYMQDFLYSFRDVDKKTTKALKVFCDELNIFEETVVNFTKEHLTIYNDIKKASKKLSISSNDVDLITKKIKLAIERGKVINEKTKIFCQEAEILAKNYLAANQ